MIFFESFVWPFHHCLFSLSVSFNHVLFSINEIRLETSSLVSLVPSVSRSDESPWERSWFLVSWSLFAGLFVTVLRNGSDSVRISDRENRKSCTENNCSSYLTSFITYPVSGTYSSDFAHWNSYFLRFCDSSIQMVNAGTFSVKAGLVHSGKASIFV